MENIRFWQNWESGYQRPFKIFGFLLIALVLALLLAAWRSPAPSVTWQFIQEREANEKLVHQFNTGPFSLQVAADYTIILEKLLGNEWQFETWPVYVYLVCVLIGFTLLITILSTLSRFWFFIGSGLLIFLITGLKLELLSVMGQQNQSSAIFLMIMLVGTGLAFQYNFQAASFVRRLSTFGLVTFSSIALLAFLAEAPNPLHYIAVGFIPATIIASALLAIFTAHEIIALIIYLITRGLRGSNGFSHFLVLSLIYVANLFAVYLSNLGWFQWEYPINPILLLVFSASLGIWGIRRQQEQIEDFSVKGPYAPLAILAMTIIAVSASAFFYTSGNDAAIETIRTISLYAHIGYGTIFIFYVISNFGSFLRNNYPVMKALYKPSSMPFFTFRFAGTIVTLAFIFYNYWKRPVNDTTGARYAALADYYMGYGDITLAEGFYKQSEFYAFHNHHANFILANIEGMGGSRIKERQYYLNAAERRPTEQAYMNAINTLDQSAINQYPYLKKVLVDFPKSGAANNALGLVFAQLNQLDSAVFYFNLAKSDRLTTATAEINLLATAVKQNLNLNIDSIYLSLEDNSPGPLANVFAYANKKNVVLGKAINLNGDTTLNLYTSSLIGNYLINRMDSLDTAFVSKAESLARRAVNKSYFESLITTCAHAYYKSGQINKAFRLMQEATIFGNNKGSNNNTMALWALDQQGPSVALNYVQYAWNQNFSNAVFTKAIASAEAGNLGEAVVLFDSVKNSMPDLKALAESAIRALAVEKRLVRDLVDVEKYMYCRYRISYADSLEFNSISSAISDPDWKARAILDRSKKLLDWDELFSAINMYNQLNGIAMSDAKLFEAIRNHELFMQTLNGNIEFLKSNMKDQTKFDPTRANEKVFYESIMALSKGDTIQAKIKLDWLVRSNAFFSEGILAAAEFAKRKGNDQLASYTILANALQINPQSVKLLKAYIREAKRLGFDDYAYTANETLQKVLPISLHKKFLETLPISNSF